MSGRVGPSSGSGTAAALRHPVLQLALLAPVVLLALHAGLAGARRPALTVGLLVVGGLLVATTRMLAVRWGRVPAWWQAGSAGVGLALLPVTLVAGLGVGVHAFALLFVLVVVTGAFTAPARLRLPLVGATLLVWGAGLWWDGTRGFDLLVLQLGAGALIAATVTRVSDDLARAAAEESASADLAGRRADLLARMLQVHTLEREEVLHAVLDGLEDVGFAAVSVRVPVGDALVLVAGVGQLGPLEPSIPAGEQLAGAVQASGRTRILSDRDALAAAGVEAEATAAIAVPVREGGHVVAVVTAATVDGPVTPDQRETAELLASLAGRSLRRAEAFEADERTVAELRGLEARTQDFVSTVSHELRTPLTVVQGLGQTLRTRWEDLDGDRRDDLLRRIAANADRLAEMVRSLLDTSAFEEGRILLTRRPVRVAALLRQLLHRLATMTADHPVEVDVAEDVEVLADRALLEHVLENLLTNTAKHTPADTRVHIRAHPVAGGRVEIAIVDDGPGIPADDLPHVLDRFYRGGEPSSRPAGGLGLGLALANQILQAHGSELTVTSEEGRGARFAFLLDPPSPTASGDVSG